MSWYSSLRRAGEFICSLLWGSCLRETESEQEPSEGSDEQSSEGSADNETSSDPKPEPTPESEPEPEPEESTSDEEPDVNRSSEEEIDWDWPPHVGDDLIPWPEPPDDPKNVIEVKLYWPEEQPWVEQACYQSVKYVRYCLLDSFAGQGYDVSVSVHPQPIPMDVDFSSWYWTLNEKMAKDANIALYRYGPEYGAAGGYGGWIQPAFFRGWGRDPADPIKNVGGDGSFSGPTAGVITLLHEIGHCLGLSHMDRVGNEVEKWGENRTTPMNAGYENSNRTRFVYEYHPTIQERAPKVQPMGER
jgi:hypothetical protein